LTQAELRDHQKKVEKLPIATGLTPEAPEGEKTILRQKQVTNQNIIKTLLLN